MLRTISTIVALPALALSLGLTACDAGESGDASNEPRASETPEHAQKMMAHLDADGSGTISAAEAEGSHFAHAFARADLDGNSEVDADELREFAEQMAEKGCSCGHHAGAEGGEGHECDGKSCKHHGGEGHECDGKSCKHHGGGKHGDPAKHVDMMLTHHDADQDGSISTEEAADTPLAEHFAAIDTNGNGALDRGELTAMMAKKKGGMHHGKPMDPEKHADAMLSKFDTDGSGAISRDEAAGTKLEHKFDRFDADADGSVTRQEMLDTMRAHHEKMKAHHGGDMKGHHGGDMKGHHGGDMKGHHGG